MKKKPSMARSNICLSQVEDLQQQQAADPSHLLPSFATTSWHQSAQETNERELQHAADHARKRLDHIHFYCSAPRLSIDFVPLFFCLHELVEGLRLPPKTPVFEGKGIFGRNLLATSGTTCVEPFGNSFEHP